MLTIPYYIVYFIWNVRKYTTLEIRVGIKEIMILANNFLKRMYPILKRKPLSQICYTSFKTYVWAWDPNLETSFLHILKIAIQSTRVS